MKYHFIKRVSGGGVFFDLHADVDNYCITCACYIRTYIYIQVYYSIYHNIFLSRKCSCRNSPTEFKSSLVPSDRYNFVCRNLKYIPLVARAGRLPVKRPRATKPLLCGRRTHACVNAYII